ncbi:putative ribonuclease H-like domain-containing protein [Tanacetum coccineum]|uniref:Ribonuclease H-like domain-containing protein n=1 Tax=Tanacetum coccineum TaxID=301880 RepID=A0ABQ4ZA27_9ASTR
MVPRIVLTRSGPISLNTARPVNTVQPRTAMNNAGPMKNVINNAYSTIRRPFNKIAATNNSNFTKKVNTVKGTRVNTARPKAVLSAVKGNKGNVVKASACNPQQDLKDKGVIDSRCSRRGKIRTGKLDFEDVYFVKELKFNLFSVSQMCDKKNCVLFTDTEYVVLSLDFKLTDESHVLLKVPRKDNMYSVDLKNVVPQGVAERKNRTLIEAARTMLADLKLPTTLWAEAVNTACYVQNRVLVIKPHNKTPYELFLGRKPALSFMRPFGCPVTILNTIDHLGKFDGKTDEGFFVGYSINIKAFRVFNSRTRIVKETMHVQFSKNTPNIAGSEPNWLFDIDALTKSMNYKPVVAGNQSNGSTGTKACDNAGKARVETVPGKDYILLPLWTQDPPFSSSSKDSLDARFKPSGEEEKKDVEDPGNKDSKVPSTEEPRVNQEKDASVNSTNTINTVSPTVNAASIEDNVVDENIVYGCADDPNIPNLEEIGRFSDAEDDDAGADMTNLDTRIPVSPIPTTRIHKDHPVEQIIGDIHSTPQTRRMTKSVTEHAIRSQEGNPSWIEAMQEELLQFKLQEVWTLVELPNGKRVIGTRWVFRNKKDERGIMIKNKSRLVAQGYTQEEGIDYDEVSAHVARIEAIRLFLAYASFKDFMVYQIDVKSAFLYGKIEEEVYVCQPLRFEDPDFPDKVYKVEKALYGLHQALRAWYASLSTYFLENRFQRGQIDKTFFIRRDKGDILLVQVYVDDIIFGSTKKSLCTEFEKMMHKKFQISSMGELTFFLGLFSDVKTASTPMESHKPLLKDANGGDIDEHKYRSMIGSLMYLTSSRPDIMFAIGACVRFQVNPKVSHLHAVKRIFRYLKGQPKLGLWYPKDSPFDLVAYTNSDYAGASLDRKSTTGGCQFLGCRLISWQCTKQPVVANSTTEAEYIAASSCYGQVLWIQNQMLDYGYNLMHTKIYIDNKSTICIVKNPILYSKTKHIEIRHHFIRDSNEKKLIQMIKIYTDHNVADLLIKAFDRIIHKGWLELNAIADRDEIGVCTVAYLEKSIENDDFTQIVDFLNASHQAKTINEETQIHAIVDGKKIVITHLSVRSDFQLADDDGMDYLQITLFLKIFN